MTAGEPLFSPILVVVVVVVFIVVVNSSPARESSFFLSFPDRKKCRSGFFFSLSQGKVKYRVSLGPCVYSAGEKERAARPFKARPGELPRAAGIYHFEILSVLSCNKKAVCCCCCSCTEEWEQMREREERKNKQRRARGKGSFTVIKNFWAKPEFYVHFPLLCAFFKWNSRKLKFRIPLEMKGKPPFSRAPFVSHCHGAQNEADLKYLSRINQSSRAELFLIILAIMAVFSD